MPDPLTRPCGICGEPVLHASSPSLGFHPIEYHDCKPVPGAKLDEALRERDEARAEVARWRKSFDGHVYISNNDFLAIVERAVNAGRERDEARADAALADKQRNAALADFGPALQRAQRERDEARADHRRSMHAAIEQRERLAQATALLRETRSVVDTWLAIAEAHGMGAKALVAAAAHIDAFLAGQPAPANPVVDDAMVDDAMVLRAHKAYSRAWKSDNMSIMDGMRAALVAALRRES